ncbi:TPA: hypothetical protein IWO58_000516 [Enterococcus faecium]|nr:hypothetical protein [Enterococcus faecium]
MEKTEIRGLNYGDKENPEEIIEAYNYLINKGFNLYKNIKYIDFVDGKFEALYNINFCDRYFNFDYRDTKSIKEAINTVYKDILEALPIFFYYDIKIDYKFISINNSKINITLDNAKKLVYDIRDFNSFEALKNKMIADINA